MIYSEEFVELLKRKLKYIKENARNIIVPCPWCESENEIGGNKRRGHYHLYISKEVPVFHCFKAGCSVGGHVSRLISKLKTDFRLEDFVDLEEVQKQKQKHVFKKNLCIFSQRFKIPEIKINSKNCRKLNYLKKRLGMSMDDEELVKLKGLILNIEEFRINNNLSFPPIYGKMAEYIENNFLGFISDKHQMIILRNIKDDSLKYIKLPLQTDYFGLLDYYSLVQNIDSDIIIMSEGIFDIYGEFIFNTTNLREKAFIYAAGLSFSYFNLLCSILFDFPHKIRPNLIILSDSDVGINKYLIFKKKYNFLMKSLTIYYNKAGKDFGSFPIIPEKIII